MDRHKQATRGTKESPELLSKDNIYQAVFSEVNPSLRRHSELTAVYKVSD